MKDKITPGIKDSEFIRGNVPMTKEEVREIVLCKLGLKENSVFFDIGSGTGSIAIEAALLSRTISVYAIEENPAAIELIKANREKFSADNVQIIQATAPGQLEKLPAPTHVFIGGTKGHLQAILLALAQNKTPVQVVLTAISLETVCEMTECIKNFPVFSDEIIQVAVSRAKKAGSHHLLLAENPVYIFSFVLGTASKEGQSK